VFAVGSSWCPRCGAELICPSAYDSDWRCSRHGRTLPLTVFEHLDSATMSHIRDRAEVPLWLPDPMPVGWLLSGLAAVGDSRSRLRATAVACRGPAPLGGEGEWLIVAEEPGIGWGAALARTSVAAPPTVDSPAARIAVRGHPIPLWPVSDSEVDRSVYAGEAAGVWFWLISFPADAGYAVLEDLSVSDVRHRQIPAVDSVAPNSRLRPGR
jgi:hypothetical protein